MKNTTIREAFSMITAIFVMVIMATVSIFVMSLSGKIVKSTTAQFQTTQAELYAKSYTEYAILAVTGHNSATNCIKTINGTIGGADGYKIRTHIAYISAPGVVGTCFANRKLNSTVTTPSTPLTIIVDAYVDYDDPDDSNKTFTVHRRSVQKI